MSKIKLWIRRIYTVVLFGAIGLMTVMEVGMITLGLCDGYSQAGDLCSHLNALCLYIALILLFLMGTDLVILRRRLLAAKIFSLMLFIVVAVALFRTLPFYLSADKTPATYNLSLLHLNLLGHYNRDQKTMFDQIAVEKPDIVLVSELCGGWEKFLDKRMEADYPYCDNLPVTSFMRIYSKYPFEFAQLRQIKYGNRARLLARIKHPQVGLVTLLLAHPYIPLGPASHFAARNEELALYPGDLKTFDCPAILVGDLNCTQWSPYFARLLKAGELKDSARGFGFAPSWPAMYLPPFLPIDHVLTTKTITVKERRLLTATGSDHYPLLVRLYVSR